VINGWLVKHRAALIATRSGVTDVALAALCFFSYQHLQAGGMPRRGVPRLSLGLALAHLVSRCQQRSRACILWKSLFVSTVAVLPTSLLSCTGICVLFDAYIYLYRGKDVLGSIPSSGGKNRFNIAAENMAAAFARHVHSVC